MERLNYAKAGVDIKKVRGIHAEVNELIKMTHGKNILPIYGHYAGFVALGEKALALHTDGVGTKVLVAQWLRKYDTVGIDCVAMNANDIVCTGAEPVAVIDYIALEREDASLVRELMKGLVVGAREAGCAIVGGETAIMPDVIRGMGGRTGFDLAATVLGIVERGRIITGARMRAGDAVIGLASSGLHSNGYTLARKVLPLDAWAREMLTPTRIYVRAALDAIRRVDVHGIAHITGGAFSKLMRIGGYAGVGFELNAMPEPAEIFREIQRRARLDERAMYRTFNMGIGMCIVVPEKDAGKTAGVAKKHGIKANKIGTIARKQQVVLVKDGKRIRLD